LIKLILQTQTLNFLNLDTIALRFVFYHNRARAH